MIFFFFYANPPSLAGLDAAVGFLPQLRLLQPAGGVVSQVLPGRQELLLEHSMPHRRPSIVAVRHDGQVTSLIGIAAYSHLRHLQDPDAALLLLLLALNSRLSGTEALEPTDVNSRMKVRRNIGK